MMQLQNWENEFQMDRDSHMLICLVRTIKEFLNILMLAGQATLFTCVGIVDVHICSWRHNVKLGVEDVYTVHHSVQSWHCKRLMAFILSHGISTAKAGNNNQLQSNPRPQYLM